VTFGRSLEDVWPLTAGWVGCEGGGVHVGD